MKVNHLEIAPKRHGAKIKDMYFKLGETKIETELSVEYLDVILDRGLTFTLEIHRASEKTMRALSIRLPTPVAPEQRKGH